MVKWKKTKATLAFIGISLPYSATIAISLFNHPETLCEPFGIACQAEERAPLTGIQPKPEPVRP